MNQIIWVHFNSCNLFSTIDFKLDMLACFVFWISPTVMFAVHTCPRTCFVSKENTLSFLIYILGGNIYVIAHNHTRITCVLLYLIVLREVIALIKPTMSKKFITWYRNVLSKFKIIQEIWAWCQSKKNSVANEELN